MSPVLAYALASKRPCCALVAVWVLAQLHAPPAHPESQSAWARLDARAWERLCVWEGMPPWSCPEEAARLLGGTMGETIAGDGWHVVQRWSYDGARGHAYLVRRVEGGYRVVESTERRGYVDRVAARWLPSGYTARVARLPESAGRGVDGADLLG